jgi:hypothetical protein
MPTVAEAGVPGYEYVLWDGFCPRKPAAIVTP